MLQYSFLVHHATVGADEGLHAAEPAQMRQVIRVMFLIRISGVGHDRGRKQCRVWN